MKYKSLLHRITPLFSLLLLIGIAVIIKKELGQYDFKNIIQSLSQISHSNIYLAIGLTLTGYSVISFYDKIALAYLQYPLPIQKIITTAFVSYAVCNTTSFALIVGGGIRYYFYRSYAVPHKTIAQILAFSNLTFWIGLLAVGGLTFLIEPLAIPKLLHLHFATVRPIGAIFLVIVSIYLYFSWQQKSLKIKGQTVTIPSLSISTAQIAISAGDWAIASAVLYVLLPSHANLSYWSFLGIYLLGITAAIISHIPGGLGVFETIVIYLLPKQITTTDALGSLLAYRGIYYLLPLAIALFYWLIYEIKKRLLLQ